MLNDSNHTSARDLRHMFEVIQIHFDREQALQTPMTKRLRDQADTGSKDAVNEIAVLLVGLADAYERAVQALRDVRHLLPSEGIAIVDAVLDCAT